MAPRPLALSPTPSTTSSTLPASSRRLSACEQGPLARIAAAAPLHLLPSPLASRRLPRVPRPLRNIVATVQLASKNSSAKRVIDLNALAQKAQNTEYTPRRFAPCIIRIRNPRSTALVYQKGKMVIMGAKRCVPMARLPACVPSPPPRPLVLSLMCDAWPPPQRGRRKNGSKALHKNHPRWRTQGLFCASPALSSSFLFPVPSPASRPSHAPALLTSPLSQHIEAGECNIHNVVAW